MSTAIAVLLTLITGIPYASVCEWALHRFAMHAPFLGFAYAYKAHALTHHRMFRADQSYHYDGSQDITKIRMAWWNGPVLILLFGLPFVVCAAPFFHMDLWTESSAISATGIAIIAGYYGAYEYLHWCMHKPGKRWFEKWRLFKRLNAHHILHHRNWKTNLNVVLPFADWLFGTLVIRSPTKFAQVRGPWIPDVQPLPS